MSCANCNSIVKYKKILIFRKECSDKYHSQIFCNLCQYACKGSLCVICEKPVGKRAFVQKVYKKGYEECIGWVACNMDCVRKIQKSAWKITLVENCEDCGQQLIKLKKIGKYIELCILCHTPNPSIFCEGCNFAKYCSEECKNADSHRHVLNCRDWK